MSAAVEIITLEQAQTITVTATGSQTLQSVAVPGLQGPPGSNGAPGPTGPQGPQGASGAVAGRVVVPFAYGDATPQAIYTAPDAGTSLTVRVVIDTPFNGVGAALSVGTTALPGALVPPAFVDPTTAATYEAAPDADLITGEAILLTITPGAGATQGAGRVIFDAID